MGVLLTGTAGLGIWIVLWALGVSGFDSFLITVLMVLIALAVKTATAGLFVRSE